MYRRKEKGHFSRRHGHGKPLPVLTTGWLLLKEAGHRNCTD